METFRIFCATKNEPNPEGGSPLQGSLSISAELKAEGNPGVLRRFTSYGGPAGAICLLYLVAHLVPLLLLVYAGTLPQSLIAKTRPVLTIFRKLGRNHSAFFVSTKNEPNPKGGSTTKGSLSISAKLKAEGNPDFAF